MFRFEAIHSCLVYATINPKPFVIALLVLQASRTLLASTLIHVVTSFCHPFIKQIQCIKTGSKSLLWTQGDNFQAASVFVSHSFVINISVPLVLNIFLALPFIYHQTVLRKRFWFTGIGIARFLFDMRTCNTPLNFKNIFLHRDFITASTSVW